MSSGSPWSRESIARHMHARNEATRAFFARESQTLAGICREMAARFDRGGRLLAVGVGGGLSDAQHIAVEFVHPVLVGKRALPALDLSAGWRERLPAIMRAGDILIAFPTGADSAPVNEVLRTAAGRGVLSIGLPGEAGDYAVAAPSDDPFVTQEVFEILYHTLWETVHVFFEGRTPTGSGTAASFLYPFLTEAEGTGADVVPEVAASIRAKAAHVERLRDRVASEQGGAVLSAVEAMYRRISAGATVLTFGNGGSATDATDLAFDLSASPKGHAGVPAISLASDGATLTALANDLGSEAVFARQVIAYGREGDVAVAFSTSGGSHSIIAGLAAARARGLTTIALVGYDGGEIGRRGLADHVIVVDSDHIPRVQEVHASICHTMLDLIDVRRHP